MSELLSWEPVRYPNEGYWATRQVLFEKYEPHKTEIFFTSIPVQAEARKLRATWAPQMADDLAAFQSIDADSELRALLNIDEGNTQTRKVIIEKWKPNSVWGTGTWTLKFAKEFHKLFAPPK